MSVLSGSDFNLECINTKQLADNINATIDFGGNLLAIARRGSGKTTITRDVIKASQHKEIYMNLAIMERPDIGGYPNFFGSRNGEKYINFLMPSSFKDLIDGEQSCVAILDEVDKADETLLAPLLEFIQYRSINGFKLKNLRAIIMTGNLPSEGGRRPPLPLLDRTEKFLVEVNPKHWLDWGAITGEIHPTIAAYIAENLNDLCGDIEPGPDNYGDTSPRGWHNASKIIFHGERRQWNPNMIKHKVSACVGKRVGAKYSIFFEHYQILLPMISKIMQGEKYGEFFDFEKTKQIVVCMMLCARFASLLDDLAEEQKTNNNEFKLTDKAKNISANIANFLLKVDPEISLISIRGQIGFNRFLNFNLINDENWDPLLSALVDEVGVDS